MSRRLRVGIFAGGRSAEHEVSISSAESILRAIDRERFEPYLVYIDRDGGWHLPGGPAPLPGEEPLAALLGVASTTEQSKLLREHADLPVAVDAGGTAVSPRAALRSLAEAIDVAFLAVHGPFGEDGTLQGFLEMAGIAYTGAGVLASALAMDKVIFKDLMRGHAIPVVDYVWFRRTSWISDPMEVLQRVTDRIGERSVVKPARLGSSVGMTLVHG
ncbi:MAG TPA: D-alanine--D-alanine ligase A, partial [Candidatus Saccharimonadales bacterium]|nr:D-alanine--D-alanine ligase A [Candidatus Saccharimonadales bacterium]